jgi:hypothetical protein
MPVMIVNIAMLAMCSSASTILETRTFVAPCVERMKPALDDFGCDAQDHRFRNEGHDFHPFGVLQNWSDQGATNLLRAASFQIAVVTQGRLIFIAKSSITRNSLTPLFQTS